MKFKIGISGGRTSVTHGVRKATLIRCPPDGEIFIPDFTPYGIARQDLFEKFVEYGLISSKTFGMIYLTIPFFDKLESIVLEYNVDRRDHTTLAVLFRMGAQ